MEQKFVTSRLAIHSSKYWLALLDRAEKQCLMAAYQMLNVAAMHLLNGADIGLQVLLLKFFHLPVRVGLTRVLVFSFFLYFHLLGRGGLT